MLEIIGKSRRLMTGILATVLIFCTLPRFSPILRVSADWGMIPVVPDVSVYEPGQKAVIAWNGREEILILTADVTSTMNTTVLQILPLPSNPERVEEASFESFEVVQGLIWYHMPPPPMYGDWVNETDEVRIVFHEKIGMHDITVVEAHSVMAFADWMGEFLVKNGVSRHVALEEFDLVIEDYMSRDFHFYVLDLIELSSDQRSVKPILYKFDTDFLYYPLLITSPVGGRGKIMLFLLTEDIIEYGYHPLRKAQYYGPDILAIQFKVSNQELSSIDPGIAELFEDKAWMTALVYDGPLGELTEDLAVSPLGSDLNLDGKVDIVDITVAAKAFGSYPGHPRWNPKADMDNDGVINIMDIVEVAKDFGEERTQQIEFQTIERGYYSGHKNSAYYVIEEESEWITVWNQHKSIFSPKQPPPEIDFSNATVIAVFMGEFSTGGYGIEIKGIVHFPRSVVVQVEKTYPGIGCVVTMALSQPYHIVKTDSIEKEVTFDTAERIIECS